MVLNLIGKPAPNFEATAYIDGGFRNVKLSEYLNHWVVLYFYPSDFGFVWPTELSAIALKSEEFKALDVQILSISTDSHFSHKVWYEEELSQLVTGGVLFPMISDPAGRIGTGYDVYDENAGTHLRARFIIDPDGVIQAMEVLSESVGSNVDELLRQIKAFQHVRDTDEVTPSGWQPGKPTLTPGPELVGKVWRIWQPSLAFDLPPAEETPDTTAG